MSKLFPFRSAPDLGDREPKLVDLDEETADEVFDALSSTTARTLLLELHEQPRPASELADEVGTTVQNVQYHLTKLEAADLVTEVDTWYSENGTEMAVYGPADEALVLFAGQDPERSLRSLLGRLVGVLGLLALGAVGVAAAVARRQSTEPVTQNATTFQTGNASARVASSGGGADPVVAAVTFVCGGLVVLAGLWLVGSVVR